MTETTEEFEPIGAGPVATVYAGLYLALKVYPEPVPDEVREEFTEEMGRLALLRGAPILPVDEVLDLPDGRLAVQSELCSPSLAAVLDEHGGLPVDEVVTVGRAMAGALAAAHGAGVLHGGLTPHNVLFGASGSPVVADFGTVLREAAGQPPSAYAAPETVLDGIVNECSDLYSLGAVLYAALTGGPPPAPEPHTTMPAPDRDDVPASLERLVTRLLAHHPADRPASAAAVAQHLENLPAETEPEPEPEVEPEPEPEPARRGRGRTIALAAGGAVVVAAGVVAVLQLADPFGPKVTAVAAESSPAPVQPVAVDLAEPVDGGAHVDLRWQAPDGFDVAVIVAAEHQPTKVHLVSRARSTRLPVEPGRTYCFQVQATDGQRTVESTPRAIRGATCRT
ncbi:protein kinase domain-containing protein [Amycolatopsis suaedae]|uniref:non-specific serine/threonine protein kinase n=1 Tax=Amycolatopsis suaedae TaxID=2510978 RepID=A0A4Q7JEE9_9PSEU|nr:protein kinase [Amycolatopsis suaedae]RZQ65869.1 serine/threonine protein kinase [Amycolatopsis suaedae]